MAVKFCGALGTKFAACVTLIICGSTPGLFTVMVATRSLVVVLMAAVADNMPSPFPEAGVTVSHVALLLAVQLRLVAMVHVFSSPAAIKLKEDGETLKIATICIKSFQPVAVVALYLLSEPAGTLNIQAVLLTLVNTLAAIVCGVVA